MKDLKKLMAICICLVTLAFGILVLVEERDYFRLLGSLSFADRVSIGGSILVIAYLVIDVLLILYPLVNLFLVAFDKRSGGPYKPNKYLAQIINAQLAIALYGPPLLLSNATRNKLTSGNKINKTLITK